MLHDNLARFIRSLSTLTLFLALPLPACGGGVAKGPEAPPVATPKAAAPTVESRCEDQALRVLRSLKGPIHVTVYATRGLAGNDTFVNRVATIFARYRSAAPERLSFEVVEVETSAQRAAAREAGVDEVTFATGDTDPSSAVKGFLGIAFTYGREKEAIPVLSPREAHGVEYWFITKMRELRDRADNRSQKLGVITGKDEIKLSEPNLVAAQAGRAGGPSMKRIFEQALPFYTLEDVDLQSGNAEIDKELVGLIVTQPRKDYTEKELRRIDQYLMVGNKAVVFFVGAVNVEAGDASMKAELNTHGLEKLLDGYGIEMKKEAIFDWARPVLLRVPMQGQTVIFPYPPVVLVQHDEHLGAKDQFLDQRFLGFWRMNEIAFPFPSTVVAHPNKQLKASMKVVARTSPKATIVTTDTVDLKITSELTPQGEYAQRAIAIALEAGCCDGSSVCGDADPCKSGTIKSAFAGKTDATITTFAESQGPSRVLVISASQFLANPFARAGNAPPLPRQMQRMGPTGGDADLLMLSRPYAEQYLTESILAFKNMLDWMSNDRALNACAVE